jgi:hypothetical protein
MKKREEERPIRKKSVYFIPNKTFIKSAIEEYLDNGGKITKVVKEDGYYQAKQYNSLFQKTEVHSVYQNIS